MRWLAGVRVRRCSPSVNTAILSVVHLHLSHVGCRFEDLFQDLLQTESLKFLLFVKEKLPFGRDPQKDEWISVQATLAMETLDPESVSQVPPSMDIVRWKGLHFASSVSVALVPPFTKPPFADALSQGPATVPP
jgi:hypothetical protein